MTLFAVHRDYQFSVELYDGSDFIILPQNVLTLSKRTIYGFRVKVEKYSGEELNGGTATLQITISGGSGLYEL